MLEFSMTLNDNFRFRLMFIYTSTHTLTMRHDYVYQIVYVCDSDVCQPLYLVEMNKLNMGKGI